MSLRTLDRAYEPPHPAGAIQTLSHQYEDLEQQNESYIVGMWTFLVQEIMFFGALFLAYSIYRFEYSDAYMDAHRFLSIPLGAANTFVLLTSSLLMALGVRAAQMGERRKLMNYLLAVIACSFLFLGIKTIEYSAKFHEKIFPGPDFDFAYAKMLWEKDHVGESGHVGEGAIEQIKMALDGPEIPYGSTTTIGGKQIQFGSTPAIGYNTNVVDTTGTGLAVATESPALQASTLAGHHAELFFCLYFIMTGLHALHIIVGILLMCTWWFLCYVKHPSVEDYMPTEMLGFYWHFVDIVWIFLFPLMYLIS